MSQPLVFYDIPGTASSTKAWTPNPWKARFALNIKGIPYKTVWVEYPDVAGLCKRIGAEPTGVRFGEPLYTLPVLQDPNTGTVVAESLKIAEYLETTYPDTTRLFPDGTNAFQAMFVQTFEGRIMLPMVQLLALPTVTQMLPRSHVHWRATVERTFGKKIEELAPEGPLKDEQWRIVLDVFKTVQEWESHNPTGIFMLGDKISFADAVIVSWLSWLKLMEGEESKAWKQITEVDNGRWARLFEAFAGWAWVDEAGLKSE